MKIRSSSISYSISKSKKEKLEYKQIERDIFNLENIMNSNSSEQTNTLLNNKQNELERKREKMVEGILLRSKATWREHGEKCSQYFCKLEKKNFVKKTISEIINDNGEHITDQNEILKQQQNFYKTLYQKKNINAKDETFFNHNV